MKKYDYLTQFINILVEHEQQHPNDIMPPAITAQFTIDCLSEAFLGPDYYITGPCGNAQCNTIILDAILSKYSKAYKKLVKQKRKELNYEKT